MIGLRQQNGRVGLAVFGGTDPLELIVRFVWAGLDLGDISPIPGRWDLENVDRFDYPRRGQFVAKAFEVLDEKRVERLVVVDHQ